MTHQEAMVSKWQRLMTKWEIASRLYQTALDAEASLGLDPEHDEFKAWALKELQETKRQIDELIVEGSQRHHVQKDSLVIGTIQEPRPSALAAREKKRK
jgi:hypothetical protein